MNSKSVISTNDIKFNQEEQITFRHKQIFEAINSINIIIHSTLTFDTIMQRALSEISKTIKCDTATISLRQGEKWIVGYVHNFPDDVIGTEINDVEEPHAVLAIKTQRPVAINDAFNDERVNCDNMKKWNVRSLLVVPLVTKDEVIGVMFFNFQESIHLFDDVDTYFATQIASSLLLSLQNSRLVENLYLKIYQLEETESKLLEANASLQMQYEEIQIQNKEIKAQTEELLRTNEALQESESRRKFAEAIETEQHRLFGVLETLPVMICLLTPDYHVAFANRGFRDKFGESGGRYCYEYCFGLTHPCDFCESHKVLETGQLHHWENTGPDGSVIDVYDYPFTDVDGSPLILEMYIDITEHRKAEEALRLSNIYNRSLIESSLDPLVTIGYDGKITDVNASTELVTGYSRKELVGTDFSDYFTEPVEAKKVYQEVFKEGIVSNYALKIQHRSGKITPVLYNASVYKDGSGKIIGIFAAARDITERKKAEYSLEKIEKVRVKEIHHRIKNNLQVISSLLDLQAEKFKDEMVIEAFKESQDRVISMSLIHEELYKGEGKGERTDKLNFSAYLEKLVSNLFKTYILHSRNIHLRMDLEKNAFLDMDTAVPLGIIVNELVSNSLKHAFTGKKESEIQIKLYKEKPNAETQKSLFSMTVSDNGKGIPEDLELENIESLGLKLISILVDQLDGEFELKRNNGTEFIVRFLVTENNNFKSVPTDQ